MALGYHGIDTSVEELREETNSGRDGVRARTLLEVARRYGVPGRGVRVSLDGLRNLSAGSILFWNFRHFVVLERVSGSYVYVVDPAYGRRRLSLADVGRMFTGVALEFEAPVSVRRRPGTIGPLLSAGPWRYLSHFLPRSQLWFVVAGSSMLILLFGFSTPLAMAYLVDYLSPESGLGLWQAVVAVLALVAFYFALQSIRGLSILGLQSKSDKQVTMGVFQHLLSLPYDYFTRRPPGDLAARVRTSTVVRVNLTGAVLSGVFDGALVFVYLVLLMIADPVLATTVLMLAGLQLCLLLGSWRRQAYLDSDVLESQVRAETELHELLDGITTLQAAGLDQILGEKWTHTFSDELNARVHSRRHLILWSSASAGLQFSAPLLVLALAANRVAQGGLSMGEAAAFAALSIGVFVSLAGLVQAGLQAAGLKPMLVRLGDILDTAIDKEGSDEIDLSADAGSVEARDIGFAYAGAPVKVLDGINLSVTSGGFLAILGPSGCGKSTLATLLAGLHSPSEGQILINRTSLATARRTSLRRTMSFVNQDARLFAGTIRDNIAMGSPDATDEGVVAAAQAAQIHDEISAMPMTYETLLGPDGAGLSGGQRQRITLARALIRRPRILILDEATSALDRPAEERVFAAILALNCTLIVITHRLATVTAADEVVIMQEGKIVVRGRHDELSSTSSLYRTLAGTETDMRPLTNGMH